MRALVLAAVVACATLPALPNALASGCTGGETRADAVSVATVHIVSHNAAWHDVYEETNGQPGLQIDPLVCGIDIKVPADAFRGKVQAGRCIGVPLNVCLF